MNKRKTTILSAILVISFLTPGIYADSLIDAGKTDRAIVTLVDEGFESGIPVNWMNTAWVLNWYGVPHNGSNFVSCNAEGGLLKTDILSFGENTELSFWYAVDNTQESLDLEVKIDNTQLWYQTVTDTTYQKATIDLSSYSGDHQISFICQTSAFTTVVNIDDILITTEINNPPTAFFTYVPSAPSTADIVVFTDASTDVDGSIVSWLWDFDDGDISTQQNPSHSFDDDGTYLVNLTVTDDDGATDSYSDIVTVSNVDPFADFSYNPTVPDVYEVITFTDESSDSDGTLILWNWDFGDGNTSIDQNPTYGYSNPGDYFVCLTVEDDDGGEDTHCQLISVTSPPTAFFTYVPSAPSTADIVVFTDASTDVDGSIVSWLWDFDDGDISTQQNPSHSFDDDGTYLVNLTVTDDDGATDSYSDIVTVSNVDPFADFDYLPLTPSTADIIVFTDASTDVDGSIVSWLWDFDDGDISTQQNPSHSFDDDGTYLVNLTVTDDDGATDSYSDIVTVLNVDPFADFSYTPNEPSINDIIDFYDESTDSDGTIVSWLWDFDDGNLSTAQNPSHSYPNAGQYNISLTVTDDDGATDITIQMIYVVIQELVDVNQSISDRGFPIRATASGNWGGAQNFTITQSTISSIDIYTRKAGTPEFNLTIELRENDPQGNLLDTVIFTPDEITSGWQWINVNVNDMSVTPGSEMFVVLPPPPMGVTTSFGYEWSYAFGDIYEDGSFWFTRDGGGLWRDLPTRYEFTFKTYYLDL